GTLTRGRPTLTNRQAIDPVALAIAGTLARQSRHPLSQALVEAAATLAISETITEVEEIAGNGVMANIGLGCFRLGRRSWACGAGGGETVFEGSEVVLSRDGEEIAAFHFADSYREGAHEAIAELKDLGLQIVLVSGDRQQEVARAARELGIEQFHAECLPGKKLALLERMSADGGKVLMVGDGRNHAPALAAAHVSLAPSSAADIGRQAADIVFTRESLLAVPTALRVARRADKLVRQNLAFSLLYNVVAVPIAVLGFVTPLVAALAMSLSSIVVVLNAMRLNRNASRRNPTSTSAIATSMEAV